MRPAQSRPIELETMTVYGMCCVGNQADTLHSLVPTTKTRASAVHPMISIVVSPPANSDLVACPSLLRTQSLVTMNTDLLTFFRHLDAQT